MGRISALTELTSLASNDYFIVLDSSANIAKKITVANAFGIPDFGWTVSGESWTYSSFNSSSRIGVMTVPTDATTKYTVGMKIKITQTTGGTKYGEVVAVTATSLSVYFGGSYTLNNEAITNTNYSTVHAPYGFAPSQRNGNCIRLGNVQICWGTNTVANAGTSVSFAQPFASDPSVAVSLRDVNNQGAWVSAISTTAVTLKQGYTTSSLLVMWVAVGVAS